MGFSKLYSISLPDGNGSGVNIWHYYLNFYQITVTLAFKIALTLAILKIGRRFWSLIEYHIVPPYKPNDGTGNEFKVVRDVSRYSMVKSLKIMVGSFMESVLFTGIMIYFDSKIGLIYSNVLPEYIRGMDGLFVSVILNIVKIPLSDVPHFDLDTASNIELAVHIVHIWAPQIPLSVFFINALECSNYAVRKILEILISPVTES
ncbi:hypothetical protein [Halopenitus persicus]|uniref:Uncharacterized protein n=1 Tax=Halopenitus persicus TaxID=1048396 RepID=A0A1H3JSA9_9EURY|nr:hypothetical protein [Halopenitus persicus]SDY42837.1 hypothetical protein SAMN05216564_105126 [Halopenitus persicus]